MFNFKNKRRASQTIEVVFAIVATLCVLFLVITMFSDNLKTLIDKGAFPGVWNPAAEKAGSQSWQIGQKQSTREIITSPEVQATSWDAILQKHNDKANKKIKNYYNQVQMQILRDSDDTQLPEGDKKFLGMWLATYASSSKDYNGIYALDAAKFEGTDYTYTQFGLDQKIEVMEIQNSKITINKDEPKEISYNWDSEISQDGLRYDEEAKARVSNIIDTGGIYSVFNKD